MMGTFPQQTAEGGATPKAGRFRVGSAPDSWGVWFPDDPRQTPWERFLDEIARAGYEWLELGPYGYLPTDPARLRDELEKRGLRVAGGTVGGPLHRAEALPQIEEDARAVARLAGALGAEHVVFLPSMYRDLHDGREVDAPTLDDDQWRALTRGAEHLGRVLREEHGMRLAFHSHVESHVETDAQIERFLAGTDPELVSLCLDTGHVAYTHGDAPGLLRAHADRIGYVHIKAVDADVLARVEAARTSFADAVKQDVMCEPGLGVPALPDVTDALAGLPPDTFVIVEHDLYPCDFDRPYPIAARTRETLRTAGVG